MFKWLPFCSLPPDHVLDLRYARVRPFRSGVARLDSFFVQPSQATPTLRQPASQPASKREAYYWVGGLLTKCPLKLAST